MQEWTIAVTLLGVSVGIIFIIIGLCRLFGGWSKLQSCLPGANGEETAQLTKNGQFETNGYLLNSESDIALDVSGNYKHYDNVGNDLKLVQEYTCEESTNHILSSPPSTSRAPIAALPTKSHNGPINSHNGITSLHNGPIKSHNGITSLHNGPTNSQNGVTHSQNGPCDKENIFFEKNEMPMLKRATSCDSITSSSSVNVESLESPHQCGELELGIEYDSETEDLIVIINRARDLVGVTSSTVDSYIKVFLLPDKTTNMQTRICRKSNDPLFKERFLFGVDDSTLNQRCLLCTVYCCDKYSSSMLGETEVKLSDLDLRKPFLGWFPIIDSNQGPAELGDIMFSLSYLPTAERLTVVVVKARNLRWKKSPTTTDFNPFVKVYLLQNGKKFAKKKTTTKRDERNPIFSEAMIFSVPSHALQTVQLRVTVADYQGTGKTPGIGHVFVGPFCKGKSLSHWNQMLSSLRKPVAMWHPLRKLSDC